VGLKAHAFTGTAEAARNETSGSSAIARDCGHAAVARAQTSLLRQGKWMSGLPNPSFCAQDVRYQGAQGSLGFSAAADSGCPLISQARLTADPGALFIGSSIFKEHSALVQRADKVSCRIHAARIEPNASTGRSFNVSSACPLEQTEEARILRTHSTAAVTT
jgi:hypothetical protein